MARLLCILAFRGKLMTAEVARAAYVLSLDTNAYIRLQANAKNGRT